MTEPSHKPLLHALAIFTACVALLPIGMGALVTTKDAGMAFRDWPTSDGHGMFAYPWLQSVGDKFLEHGHRLGGIAIGLASIALCVSFALAERRGWVKLLAFAALAAVVGQGILGGQRVLLDARGLAFVHGSFAALVFALLAGIAVVTSRRWNDPGYVPHGASPSRLKLLAIGAAVAVFAQYVLGGLVRHQGKALYEHLGFAFVAAALALALAMAAAGSGIAWLRRPATLIAALTLGQLALGAGTWFTKFGFGEHVAVYGSGLQVGLRTAHVLTGMLLFATVVVVAVRVSRVHWLDRRRAIGSRSGLAIETLGHFAALPGGMP